MATIKSFTDIEQSRKLAEILPFESADQTWVRIAIAGANLNVPEELQYRHNGDIPFKYHSGIGIPCWSLAALLNVLKYPSLTQHVENKWSIDDWTGDYPKGEYGFNNPIDTCYEMILKLHELKML